MFVNGPLTFVVLTTIYDYTDSPHIPNLDICFMHMNIRWLSFLLGNKVMNYPIWDTHNLVEDLLYVFDRGSIYSK